MIESKDIDVGGITVSCTEVASLRDVADSLQDELVRLSLAAFLAGTGGIPDMRASASSSSIGDGARDEVGWVLVYE